MKEHYNKLTKQQAKEFRAEAQRLLGVGMVQMYRYINGKTELKLSQAKIIRELFKKYGVKFS